MRPTDAGYYAAGRKVAIEWPEHDPKPEVCSTDPRPADAPAEPKAVRDLAALAERSGFEVRTGYSRGQARAVKKGTYKRVQAFGIYGRGSTGLRFSAVHVHSLDLKGGWKWDSVAMWMPGEVIAPGIGSRFVHATVTDLKEWLSVRGSVPLAWYKAIHAKVLDQQERQRAAAKVRPSTSKMKEGAS